MKKTLIIGASSNPERYSNRAAIQLMQQGHEVIQLGNKAGEVNGNLIYTSWPAMENIDTVSLYINPLKQKNYYDLLLLLHPKRIIFNPGTENPELEELATSAGIHALNACTLILLSLKNY